MTRRTDMQIAALTADHSHINGPRMWGRDVSLPVTRSKSWLVRHQWLHSLSPHRRRWLVRCAIYGMLGEHLHRGSDSLLQLSIVPVSDILRPVLDVDVR